MPWWAWVLIGWAVVAAACGMWWGLAMANADTQDAARRITEETSAGKDVEAN